MIKYKNNRFFIQRFDMGRPKGFEREAVLESAIQLFWKKGFADTSLQDLEKATGVNKSGLYTEFKDKDDIFIECLKYYKDKSKANELLQVEPLGWQNIKNFLHAGTDCQGQKGCLMVNTVRELSILPSKIKNIIDAQVSLLKLLLVKNLEATSSKKKADELADIILTFNTGLKLKLNSIKPEMVGNEIENFLNLLKK